MIELEIYNAENSMNFIKNSVFLGIILTGIYFLAPDTNKITFVILLIIFIFYFAYKEKRKKSIGKIHLDNHRINIKTDDKDVKLELSEIQIIEIIYSGYVGKKVKGDFLPKFNKFSGLDNYVKILIGNEKYEYNILFENLTQENELIGLVEKWDKFGYDISKIKISR